MMIHRLLRVVADDVFDWNLGKAAETGANYLGKAAKMMEIVLEKRQKMGKIGWKSGRKVLYLQKINLMPWLYFVILQII